MDVNVTLKRIRELAEKIEADEYPHDDEAHELAALMIDLDQWLTGGGFLPNGWAR